MATLAIAIGSHFTLLPHPWTTFFASLSSPSQPPPLSSQQTPDEFKREYQTRVESTGREYTSNAYHAYDAVWAVAIALHNYTVQQQLLLASGSGGQTCSGTRRLDDFVTVDNSQEQRCTWQAIQSSLERVEFTGVSVRGSVGLLWPC